MFLELWENFTRKEFQIKFIGLSFLFLDDEHSSVCGNPLTKTFNVLYENSNHTLFKSVLMFPRDADQTSRYICFQIQCFHPPARPRTTIMTGQCKLEYNILKQTFATASGFTSRDASGTFSLSMSNYFFRIHSLLQNIEKKCC